MVQEEFSHPGSYHVILDTKNPEKIAFVPADKPLDFSIYKLGEDGYYLIKQLFLDDNSEQKAPYPPKEDIKQSSDLYYYTEMIEKIELERINQLVHHRSIEKKFVYYTDNAAYAIKLKTDDLKYPTDPLRAFFIVNTDDLSIEYYGIVDGKHELVQTLHYDEEIPLQTNPEIHTIILSRDHPQTIFFEDDIAEKFHVFKLLKEKPIVKVPPVVKQPDDKNGRANVVDEDKRTLQTKINDKRDKCQSLSERVNRIGVEHKNYNKQLEKYRTCNTQYEQLLGQQKDNLRVIEEVDNVPQPELPEVNREHALANNQQLGVEEVPKKKKGGGGSDWKKKPTFGKSHNTFSQLIDDGFTFNGYVLTITDNWHTDFAKTSSVIGDENHVRIVTYAADTLKSVSLSLGLPEIGKKSDAETSILLNLEHDYNADVLYSVSDVTHEQKEKLINEDKTKVHVSNVKCNENSNSKSCYAFDIFFTVMAPLNHDVLSITAVDNHRRSHTTFINEGVEFIGESLLDPETVKLFQKKSNQDKGNWLELIREDRRYNIWIDENGLLWEKNNYNSFKQITFADYTKADDSTKNVMTRLHSAFNGLIQSEAERAISVWNSTAIQSQIGGSFAYDIPTTYSNKLDDPKIINSLQYQEKLAIQQLNLD